MNRVVRALPRNPQLEQYKKQAKELVKAHAEGDAEAGTRIRDWLPRASTSSVATIFAERFTLSDAQLVLAREHGFQSWPKLKQRIATLRAEHGDLAAQLETFKSAIELGDADELRRVVARFPRLQARLDEPLFSFNRPALLAAKDSPALLLALLDLGADINARSAWQRGSYGVLDDAKPEIAEMLLERGARLDIHSAAQLGKVDAVQAFLRADSALVEAREPDGKFPLHCASRPEIVDLLLDGGADIDARDIDHVSTAAQYSIKESAVLRRLVERGCELDIFMAAALGDIALIDRALAAAPDSLHGHAPTMIGETSAESGYFYPPPPTGSAHIYTWSLGFGWSVPYTAWQLGHLTARDYILEKLPLADQAAEACVRGETELALVLAAKCSARELTLSPKKVDLVAGRRLGIRNLRFADGGDAPDNAERVVASLTAYLKAGFDPSAPAYWGFTPLHWAAWLGHADAVRVLLDGGADPERTGGPMNARAELV